MKTNNPFIEAFDKRLTEFEQRIEEDDYNLSVDGFEDEFYQLKDDAQSLYDECIDKGEANIVEGFMKRLNAISDEHGFCNEDEERDRMFPNGTDDDE